MEQEIINKEVWKWEYFPEKDIRKIKSPSKDGLLPLAIRKNSNKQNGGKTNDKEKNIICRYT